MHVLEPAGRVHLMENHDAAYYCWRDEGVKNRILVHIDAHNDMWWIEDKQSITIANYICPALKERLVREVYWVVPDASFCTAANRRAVARHLRRIAKKYPGGRIEVPPSRGYASASILHRPLRICRLSDLPKFDEPVLLDIDVDYLVLPRVTFGDAEPSPILPWRWPEQLLEGLSWGNVTSDLVTIAYSVEGGYTPLEWKYLGDELALLLRGDISSSALHHLRDGACAQAVCDVGLAESYYREAATLLPDSAAPIWRLAQLCARLGRIEEGREHYRRALELDSSYRTAYASRGIPMQRNGLLREAEREYDQSLRLDPENAWAHLGLGQIALKEKRWEDASARLSCALSLDSTLVDANRAQGQVFEKQGRLHEAAEAYERSLKLALAGHRPLSDFILTYNSGDLLDGEHGRIYVRLGKLYERSGQLARAIAVYQIAVAANYNRPSLHLRLAKLYMAQGKLRKIRGHIWEAFKVSPRTLQEGFWRVRRFLVKHVSDFARRARELR